VALAVSKSLKKENQRLRLPRSATKREECRERKWAEEGVWRPDRTKDQKSRGNVHRWSKVGKTKGGEREAKKRLHLAGRREEEGRIECRSDERQGKEVTRNLLKGHLISRKNPKKKKAPVAETQRKKNTLYKNQVMRRREFRMKRRDGNQSPDPTA